MRLLHIFNCSNDLSLASNSLGYIPPRNILQMEQDLSSLPLWWADDEDAVLLQEPHQIAEAQAIAARIGKRIIFTTPDEGYNRLCSRCGTEFRAAPWGWSKDIARRLLKFGFPEERIPDGEQLGEIRRLSSKKYATEYIQRFLSNERIIGNRHRFVGERMRYLQSIDALKIAEPTILKSPWSSSGRGVFSADSIDAPSIREKLSGFINRQGGFIADKLYNKILDFALEFRIDDGVVKFAGYSVFTAADNGYYGYNIIESQEKLQSLILSTGIEESLLTHCIETHATLLESEIAKYYNGYLGIDMLVADIDDCVKIHPCIEINLRMNMGVAAIFINNATKGEDTLLSPDSSKIFIAKTEKRRLIIQQG